MECLQFPGELILAHPFLNRPSIREFIMPAKPVRLTRFLGIVTLPSDQL